MTYPIRPDIPPAVGNALGVTASIGLGTQQLWLSATSLDAAKRLARQALTEDLLNIYHATAPATEDDWNDAAGRIQRMARAIAENMGRMPLEWTGPIPTENSDPRPPTLDGGSKMFRMWIDGRDLSGQQVHHIALGGWSVDNLTEERGGMLAIEAELLDVLGATQPTNGSASDKAAKDLLATYRQLAEERWAAFKAHGAIEPTEGLEGFANYGLTEPDVLAINALWSRYIQDSFEQPAKTLALVAIFAWLDVLGERDRDARRTEEIGRRARQHVGIPRPLARVMTSGAVPDGERRLVVANQRGRVTVVHGPRIVLPTTPLEPMHGLVAAELARAAHRQWQALEDNANELVFPVGRDALRERFGETSGADELFSLVRDLMECEVEDFRLVEAVNLIEGRQSNTGRPAMMMRVVLGVPLAPLSLFKKLEDHGVEWPHGERWFSPVLPQFAGGVLERRLRKRERHAVEVVLPSLLMDRRVEYADQGVAPVELAGDLATLSGFTERQATDLLERLANEHRGQGWLGAVFEPVAARASRYRLGRVYHEAHTMICEAARVTSRAQKGAERSRNAKRRKNKK